MYGPHYVNPKQYKDPILTSTEQNQVKLKLHNHQDPMTNWWYDRKQAGFNDAIATAKKYGAPQSSLEKLQTAAKRYQVKPWETPYGAQDTTGLLTQNTVNNWFTSPDQKATEHTVNPPPPYAMPIAGTPTLTPPTQYMSPNVTLNGSGFPLTQQKANPLFEKNQLALQKQQLELGNLQIDHMNAQMNAGKVSPERLALMNKRNGLMDFINGNEQQWLADPDTGGVLRNTNYIDGNALWEGVSGGAQMLMSGASILNDLWATNQKVAQGWDGLNQRRDEFNFERNRILDKKKAMENMK